jgi:hypothetical protein
MGSWSGIRAASSAPDGTQSAIHAPAMGAHAPAMRWSRASLEGWSVVAGYEPVPAWVPGTLPRDAWRSLIPANLRANGTSKRVLTYRISSRTTHAKDRRDRKAVDPPPRCRPATSSRSQFTVTIVRLCLNPPAVIRMKYTPVGIRPPAARDVVNAPRWLPGSTHPLIGRDTSRPAAS